MLDDLLKILERRYHRHARSHHHDSDHYFFLLDLIKKVLRNRFILFLIIFLLAAFIAIAICFLAALIPLLNKLLSIVEKQGIKGIVEIIALFLQRIWEGSGK